MVCATGPGPWSSDVHAAEPSETDEERPVGLTDKEQTAFVNAKLREDALSLRSILIASIVQRPDQAVAIVKDASRLAPAYAEMLQQLTIDSFPNLAERVKAAIDAEANEEQPAQTLREDVFVDAGGNQVVADPETESEGGDWSGETVIGGSHRNATENSVTLTSEFKTQYETEKWVNSVGLEFDYGAINDDAHTHIFEAQGRSKRKIKDDLFGYGQIQYTDDRFDGLAYQWTEGIGLGYEIFENEDLMLSVEGGPSLRQSKIERTGQLSNEVLGRLATNFEWFVSDTATFTNETALLFTRNSIEIDSNAYGELSDGSETTNTSALDLQIIGNLGARLSYEINYQSEPPMGQESTVSVTKFSLVHGF